MTFKEQLKDVGDELWFATMMVILFPFLFALSLIYFKDLKVRGNGE